MRRRCIARVRDALLFPVGIVTLAWHLWPTLWHFAPLFRGRRR